MTQGDAYETVIGLEIHVQLKTASKMFCGCSTAFGAPPNTHVCPVCLGLPGALPVSNREAIRLAVRAALMLGCEVSPRSEFVRKQYFYPDLPKGYQVSQFAHPLALRGQVVVADPERTVRIRRLHVEEDAGKLVHDRFEGATAVDLNRAGVPLVEIVTEPDLRSPKEARAFLGRLKQLLEHYACVSDCNMEEGSLRVDANLSVRAAGDDGLGTKTEVKNLNSFGNVERALIYEADRHQKQIEAGLAVEPETRLYDADRGTTRAMRGKEEEFDYRYFPEPDLPLLRLDEELMRSARAELPDHPLEIENRLASEYDLSAYDAGLMAATPERAAYYEDVVAGRDPEFAKTAANFVMGEVAAELKLRDGAREADLLSAASLSRLVELRRDGTLSSRTAADALERLFGGETDVDEVVERHGLSQVQDVGQLEEWVDAVLQSNPDEVRRYLEGDEKLLGFFMGQVMQAAGGRADPGAAKELLRSRLEAGAARS